MSKLKDLISIKENLQVVYDGMRAAYHNVEDEIKEVCIDMIVNQKVLSGTIWEFKDGFYFSKDIGCFKDLGDYEFCFMIDSIDVYIHKDRIEISASEDQYKFLNESWGLIINQNNIDSKIKSLEAEIIYLRKAFSNSI